MLSFEQMPLFSFSSLVILFSVLSVFTCGQHVKTKQKLLSVTRFCQTLPQTLSVHPDLPHRPLVLHVCGEGTCPSSAQYLTMKGKSYSTLATMYQCKAGCGLEASSALLRIWSDPQIGCAEAVTAHLSDSTGLRTVCVCSTFWTHAFTPVWTIPVGRMEVAHTRCSGFCVCAVLLCVYTLMSTSACRCMRTHKWVQG